MNLEDKINIEFKETLAPACMTHKKGISKIVIKIPISYTKDTIIDMLNHEIGTHYTRKFNNSF